MYFFAGSGVGVSGRGTEFIFVLDGSSSIAMSYESGPDLGGSLIMASKSFAFKDMSPKSSMKSSILWPKLDPFEEVEFCLESSRDLSEDKVPLDSFSSSFLRKKSS